MGQRSEESVADGRYAIGEVVGRGRRCRVHAARDRILHRPVAVKFLPVDGTGTPRWRAEAAALDRLDHPHLVRLLDGGESDGESFLVLPLMAEPLSARLHRGPMGREEAAAVVLALADALGHVHRAGMVHGAVDADGVLLDPYGRPCWSGLPSPDAVTGWRAVDTDLYALAVLAVRCVTGDDSGRTAPTAVLDAVRAASAAERVPGTRRRLACALESVAPVPPRPVERVAQVARRVRLRGRPGFAAVLAAGFAASVLGGIVVDGGPLRSGTDAPLGGAATAVVLADPASSDVLSSIGGALDRLGTLAAAPPAPSRLVRVADDGAGDRSGPGGVVRDGTAGRTDGSEVGRTGVREGDDGADGNDGSDRDGGDAEADGRAEGTGGGDRADGGAGAGGGDGTDGSDGPGGNGGGDGRSGGAPGVDGSRSGDDRVYADGNRYPGAGDGRDGRGPDRGGDGSGGDGSDAERSGGPGSGSDGADEDGPGRNRSGGNGSDGSGSGGSGGLLSGVL